jgi:uncharacterized protein YecE (DUF72 family)
MQHVRVGISGWRYPPWREVFYPPGLRQADELSFASRQFPTIELNGSFYSLQRPQSYRAWYEATPEGFVFAIKGSRFITHMKRLRDVEGALANFCASGLLCLAEKLGPILWQLPPSVAFDEAALRAFLQLLPRDTRELARLARRHDSRVAGRSVLTVRSEQPVRHALEVRHPSFQSARFLEVLAEHRVACCVADSAGRFPMIDATTTDFAYVRLHGAKELYVSGYSPSELRSWAARITGWRNARDVFVYFDNDVKVRAPFDALNLARILAGQPSRRLPAVLGKVTEAFRLSWDAWSRFGGSRRGNRA